MTGIDNKKLSELIESFYNLTKIKVAVYDTDFCEVIAYPEKDSDFCTMIHNNSRSCKECAKSMQKLCAKCANEKKVIIEKCHAGLTEVIAPLINGLSVVGYIMFGQITNEPDVMAFSERVADACKNYEIDSEILEKELSKVLYYSDKQLSDASKILDAVAKYIVFDKIVYPVESSVVYDITEYIRKNLGGDLTIEALCKKFFLSRTEIYKITKPYMPDGIAAFIKEERLSKAARLLVETNKSNWEIAEATGFSDVEYFLRVFKKKNGVSVAAYRKKR